MLGAAVVVACSLTGIAAAVFATGAGGMPLGVYARSSDALVSTDLASFRDVPGASVLVSVPQGESRFFDARFSAASRCVKGSVAVPTKVCSARVVATQLTSDASVELHPEVQGLPKFAFESPGSADAFESHAMERSIRLGGGRYRIQVEYAVTGDWIMVPGASATGQTAEAPARAVATKPTRFELAYWHFAVQTSN